jgi:putative phosphoesterase
MNSVSKNQNKKSYDFSEHMDITVGVLSDTHSFINPNVFNHLKSCDLILHAGDIGSADVIQQLLEISQDVVSVCGNNDNQAQWSSSEYRTLEAIPQIAEIALPGGSIAITHGDEHFSEYDIWHQELRTSFPDAKAIVYGHSHRLVCDLDMEPWVLNPGPAGETRTQRHGVSCLRIAANKEEWKVTTFRV